MSHMSSIHQELSELGADKARVFEVQINKIRNEKGSMPRMIEQLTNSAFGPGLSENAAHMLITGAKTFKISKMLESINDY